MALSEATLASELLAMPETMVEAEAAANMATAWDNYFQDAVVTAIPVVAGTTAAAKALMQSALSGMSAPGAGPALFQAALIAYWGGISTAAAVIWVKAPVLVSATPPPTVATPGGILAALAQTFIDNVDNEESKADATAAIATILHASVGLGGFAVDGIPTSFPIT